MSSIPVQFLIYVLPVPTCTQLPILLPLTDCLIFETNVPITFILYAYNPCNTTRTIITDISVTIQINGINSTQLMNSTSNSSLSYKIFNWIPLNNQIGSQHMCAIAYTKFVKISFFVFNSFPKIYL